MNVRINQVKEEDFEELIDLFKEFAEFENLPERMINTVEKMKDEKDFFNGFVIRNEETKIIGYTIFFFAYYTWTGKTLYMDDLYICKEYRGEGLGSLLINKVIELAKSSNCYKLRWQVSDWNHPAIKFYKGLGATIDNVERNCDLILN